MTTYPTKKRVGKLGAAGISLAVVLLMCCGVGTVGALVDGGGSKPVPGASASQQNVADQLASTAANPTPGDAAGSPSAASTGSPSAAITPASTPSGSVQPSPTRTVKPSPRPQPKPTTAKPRPKPTTAKPKPPALPVVHPGAFCKTQGARGVTKTGKPMVCTTTATDSKKRWRAA